MSEMLIGEVNHYFSRLGVAGLDLREPLRKGDRIHIVGHTTDLEEWVDSIEIEHHQIEEAEPGDDIAIKVPMKVRHGDKVYRMVDAAVPVAALACRVTPPSRRQDSPKRRCALRPTSKMST